MQTELPFYESPEDAVRAAVSTLGGAKKVGSLLWRDLLAENAGRKLLDCLNPSRAEKLDISQVMFIFSLAREAGHHEPFNWYAAQIGYDAKPVTRAEEKDRLTSVLESSTRTMTAALAALERLQRTAPVRAVA